MNFRLEIAGDGPLRSDLVEFRGQLGLDACVEFAGGLGASAIQEKLRQADIFVLPSRTEALSLALLEAMAHGVAIVATAVGGIPSSFATARPVCSCRRIPSILSPKPCNGWRRTRI